MLLETKTAHNGLFGCADGGTRTHKGLHPIDFESIASANCATSASLNVEVLILKFFTQVVNGERTGK